MGGAEPLSGDRALLPASDGWDDRQVEAVGDQLSGKTVTLGLTGGIAAIEAPRLARELRRYGAAVRAVMTPAAERILTPAAMEWATGHPVVGDLSGRVEHLAREDAFVVYPATLNTISKVACGIADNALTTALASAWGRGVPILMAPAMHQSLFRNPAFQKHLAALSADPVFTFLSPVFSEGKAKIFPWTEVLPWVRRRLSSAGPLAGRKILLTGGPTEAPLDRFRHLSNRSSGRLSCRVAGEAFCRGADVTLVYGPGTAMPPPPVKTLAVRTSQEMRDIVLRLTTEERFDVAIMAAAVLDFVPETVEKGKHSSAQGWTVPLVPTEKIIERLPPGLPRVAFKLESGRSEAELLEIGRPLLARENTWAVVAGNLEGVGPGEAQESWVITAAATHACRTKEEIAERILDVVAGRFSS